MPKNSKLELKNSDSNSDSNFGRDPSRRCEFLSHGQCTIWSNRPSVCRTYFCVSNSGSEGQARWREAELLGNEAEWTLAHELLFDMGFTPQEISGGSFAEWTGRERELFLEIARRAFDSQSLAPIDQACARQVPSRP